ILFAGMTEANRYFSSGIACLINTVLILIFAAYLVKKDFPLKSLPVVGKYFRK
ncbi:polysaccharide biosynthesis protein, partial [human gut metagenome]